MKKNEIYEINITGLGNDGEGVGRVDDFVVFVPKALPDERVRAQIVKVSSSFAHAKLLDVLIRSPHRIEPECPHFAKCGGCSLWHMTYDEELRYKTQKVTDNLQRIGGIETAVRPTLPSPLCKRYRNKALFPVGSEGIGLFAPRSHRIIPVNSCLIQDDVTDKVIEAVNSVKIVPYDESSHTGEIRHLLIRTGEEIMVCIVTKTGKLTAKNELIQALSSIPGVKSIIQNINPAKTNVALGRENSVLWGHESIFAKLFDLSFKISPNTFFQVNTPATHLLYETARKFASLSGSENVLDLYCGIGTISLHLARYARKVTGVEIVPQSIQNARENAQINGIKNSEFILGSAEQVSLNGTFDVVVLDPPRKGLDSRLISFIINLNPSRIVYISCNSATLARDLKLLSSHYSTDAVQPVDMFPRTPHVECVVKLIRTA